MARSRGGFTLLLVVLCAFLAVGTAYAERVDGPSIRGRQVAVTITNLTRGQIITPPVVIVHNEKFLLFVPGEPAIHELAALAEDGDTGPHSEIIAGGPANGPAGAPGTNQTGREVGTRWKSF